MKSISASIIVAAGLATAVSSAKIGHSDTGLFLTAIGIVAAVASLAGWIKTLREP